MATGPLDASRPWEPRDVVGMHRFLQRLWRNMIDEDTGEPVVTDAPADDETRRQLHRTIDFVRTEIEGLRFNTAIAKLIELNNHLTKAGGHPARGRRAAGADARPRSPPTSARSCGAGSATTTRVTYVPFPDADPALLVEETVEYPVQVNGKLRGHVTVPVDAPAADVEAAALADATVAAAVGDATPKKVIVVPGRMVNVVV